MNITGGKDEAKAHLANFQKECVREINLIKERVSALETMALNKKMEADKIKTIFKPSGLGAGSFSSMEASKDRLMKAALEQEVKEIRAETDELSKMSNKFVNIIKYIEDK